MFLIVGLGNPGKAYAGSRHNLGFRVVEALSQKLKSSRPAAKHRSLCVLTDYKGRQLLLAQPLTYMNLSGRAVNELVANYQVALENLLVIYDDLDLSPGVIRLRQRGGSAGHRGLQSIIDVLGTDQFARLRIGIGKTPGGVDSAEYVTGPVDEPDRTLLAEAVDRAVEAVLMFVGEGPLAVMNSYNQVKGDKIEPVEIVDED
jgi:peptidyl-tRNA hydrolase, PTH1 family